MLEKRFPITALELVNLHSVLSSEVCMRIFELLRRKGKLGVTAASRIAGSNTTRATTYLKTLSKLGVTREERFNGQHLFHALPDSEMFTLLEDSIRHLKTRSESP